MEAYMNELTKDELQDLLFCVKDHTGYQGDSIHENLINKIQSMIDNYCEHKDKKNINNCIDCGVSEYRCNNCATVNYDGLE